MTELLTLASDFISKFGLTAFVVLMVVWVLLLNNRAALKSRTRAEEAEAKEDERKKERETWERQQIMRSQEIEIEFRKTLQESNVRALEQNLANTKLIAQLNEDIVRLRTALKEAREQESKTSKEALDTINGLKSEIADLKRKNEELMNEIEKIKTGTQPTIVPTELKDKSDGG